MLLLLRKKLLEKLREESRKDGRENLDRSQSMARLTRQDTKTARNQSSQAAMALLINMSKNSQLGTFQKQSPSPLKPNHQLQRRVSERKLLAPLTETLKSVKACHVRKMRIVLLGAAHLPWPMVFRHAML